MQSQQGRGESDCRDQHRDHDIEGLAVRLTGHLAPVHGSLLKSFPIKLSSTAAGSDEHLSIFAVSARLKTPAPTATPAFRVAVAITRRRLPMTKNRKSKNDFER
jgi:hypothetical protein